MLILTRKPGEIIIIGTAEIKVAVLGVQGSQVRIGVKAPRHLEVHREEVYARLHPEYDVEQWQPGSD